MTNKNKPKSTQEKSTSKEPKKFQIKTFFSELLIKARKNKKISIPIVLFLIAIIIIFPITFGGSSSNTNKDVCEKAIEDGDYSTFYREACAANSKYSKNDFIQACENSGKKFYDNPSSSASECVSEDEYNDKVEADEKVKEEKAKKKAECEANEGKWDGYSCKSKEQLEAEAKAAEEKKKQEEAKKAEEEAKKAEDARKAEEANKTTTITGQDHDENDNAGKYNTIMNACLDKVDSWYPNAYPFDSDDGYPIYYSITVKADGTLVEGSMKGKIKTYHGNKILDYTCNYKDGAAKLKGLDD